MDDFTTINESKIEPNSDLPKILILTWEFPPYLVGGLSRHVHGLTKYLKKQNMEIHVITTRQKNLASEELIDGVHVYRVSPLNNEDRDFLSWIGGLNIAIVERTLQLRSQISFDCIHAHDWLVGAAAIVLKKELAIPLITTIHATEFGRNNGIYTEMQYFIHGKENRLAEKSDQVIVCSDSMKEEVGGLFPIPSEKITIIANGIEREQNVLPMRKGIFADMPIDPKRKMVFSIGRIVREKGFETIIEAAPLLRKKYQDVYFIIAGKGPMLEEYRRKVLELGLSEIIYFIGFVDDEKRKILFDHCDVAVFPSNYEPFGIVALESMLVGKPTIVSYIGGLKGIVKHLETGLFIESGNKESLIKQLEFVFSNPELSKQIGNKGKEIVESQFSWNHVAEETIKVYKKAIRLR